MVFCIYLYITHAKYFRPTKIEPKIWTKDLSIINNALESSNQMCWRHNFPDSKFHSLAFWCKPIFYGHGLGWTSQQNQPLLILRAVTLRSTINKHLHSLWIVMNLSYFNIYVRSLKWIWEKHVNPIFKETCIYIMRCVCWSSFHHIGYHIWSLATYGFSPQGSSSWTSTKHMKKTKCDIVLFWKVQRFGCLMQCCCFGACV